MSQYDILVSSLQQLTVLFSSNNAMEEKWGKCGEKQREEIKTNCDLDPCFCYINQSSWGYFFKNLTLEWSPLWKVSNKEPIVSLLNGWRLSETGESLLSNKTISLINIILNDGNIKNEKSMEDYLKMFRPEIDSVLEEQITSGFQGLNTSEPLETTLESMNI
jgi:hypothetical protein